MALRFNPPPGWPTPPEGFVPGPGWQPDPNWPPAPPGWQLWVTDGAAGDDPAAAVTAAPGRPAAVGGGEPHAAAEAGYWQPPSATPPAYGTPSPASGWAVSPPPSGINGKATAALVLGLLGFVGISAILAIVFGVQALGRIRSTLQQGRGRAIAGIVLGSAWLVLAVVLVVVGSLNPATPGPSSGSGSAGASGQRVGPFSLVAGDCFDNPHVTDVTSVVQTSCTQPHNAQIFATFDTTGSILGYPGSAKLDSIATSGCNARAKSDLNSAMITNSMRIRLLFPQESSWIAGQRKISCMIYSPTSDMTSSVLKH
jgi:hypothetical protein